ncbi:MAG: hypothetical protein IJ828_07555 [Treponema sp.]|nr:hypothetical protein [Treponema sp.]
MKKYIAFFICFLCLAAGAVAKTSFREGETLYVSVKSSELKNGTGRFASKVAKVTYGDRVTVLQPEDKNTKVKLSDGTIGWIATGSLTRKKIVKSSGGSTVKASTSEIALAGKGFSDESEKAYKSSNSALDYAGVDEMEKISVSSEALQSFIETGNLSDGGEE